MLKSVETNEPTRTLEEEWITNSIRPIRSLKEGAKIELIKLIRSLEVKWTINLIDQIGLLEEGSKIKLIVPIRSLEGNRTIDRANQIARSRYDERIDRPTRFPVYRKILELIGPILMPEEDTRMNLNEPTRTPIHGRICIVQVWVRQNNDGQLCSLLSFKYTGVSRESQDIL